MSRTVATIVGPLLMVTGLIAQAVNGTEKLVTVCDIIAAPDEYSGKTVALLGRADCSSSVNDTSCFLAEDQCPHPLVTHGHRWPAKIWIEGVHGDEFSPQLSGEQLVVNESAVSEKLVLIRRSTKLGFHKEMVSGTDDKKPKWANLKDEWGIAYGMLVFHPKLKPRDNCSGRDEGCGRWNETPLMLVVRQDLNNFTTFPDEKYQPQTKQ